MTGCIVRFSSFLLVPLLVTLQPFIIFAVGYMDLIQLKHLGKRDILKKIDLMEPEFDQPMMFDDSRVPAWPVASGTEIGSWGYRVQVYGAARGHKEERNSITAC